MNVRAELDVLLVVTSIAHLVAVGALFAAAGHQSGSRRLAASIGLIAYGTAGGVALEMGLQPLAIALVAAGGFAVMVLLAVRWSHHKPAGTVVWGSFLLMTAGVGLWACRFLVTIPVSVPTRVFLLATAAVSALSLPSSLIQTFEGWEVLLRQRWFRPHEPLRSWVPSGRPPMVSVHVPAHAEPPELVISTLDSLARLDYPNFEVLVIDNNTTDESLWRPVADHCVRLGSRFRFLHVEGITGAKAGALNWALPYTDPEAELVAVVDADYQVDRSWLAHTVGFFEDPMVGFVQCPHAYRDYEQSRFGRMANTEYAVFFATSMVSLSEHGAGLTVGTMSLIRRRALVETGGWAEWCLTEDSELAIRIHALGYTSIYLSTPYGRGLIPETFAAYKKQRFRWTYGPVQELRYHAPLFAGRQPGSSALSRRQRVHHANHGLDVAMIGLRLMAVPLGLAAVVCMIWHREAVPFPGTLWVAATSMLAGSLIMRWMVYRQVLGASLRKALGSAVAFLALTHVITVASLTATFGRAASWQRTDKFRPPPSGSAALRSVRTETILGVSCLVAAVTSVAAWPHRGMATAIAIGIAWQGLTYLAAPLVAAIAERDLRRQMTIDDLAGTSQPLELARSLPAP